ncbi:glycosyl transferase/ family 4 [Synechococcus sp. A18-25c]|nr:glycosyltransferase family 4 protein [Synechococcus sp. A18-25c]QNJ18448.1 glycosyl transferase/ family 4 [Synechococcus sp. A18-25c]
MRILFVHQSFPGQYRHVLRALAKEGGHQIVGLGIHPLTEPIPDGVTYVRYTLSRGTGKDTHSWASETETKVIRGEACAKAAHHLVQQGFYPDLICAHPGWGEALFLKDVWPAAKVLSYQEFYYRARGFDYDFDSELQGPLDWQACAKLRMKNANNLLMLELSDWSVTPTLFQRSSFPLCFQDRISVIHDGIDTQLAAPDPAPQPCRLPGGVIVSPGELIVTFVNRRIEPYRGCLTFIRSIPAIQRLCPTVKIVVVGGHEGVSYGQEPPVANWRDICLAQIRGHYDESSIHFVGNLDYQSFLSLLKLSTCHVYLTYPFVLSWSLLEAMSVGLPIVGSSTAPVQEVIRDGENGMLVDFFSPDQLAHAVAEILSDREKAIALGRAARETILANYSLERCVPQQLQLMQLVAGGVF